MYFDMPDVEAVLERRHKMIAPGQDGKDGGGGASVGVRGAAEDNSGATNGGGGNGSSQDSPWSFRGGGGGGSGVGMETMNPVGPGTEEVAMSEVGGGGHMVPGDEETGRDAAHYGRSSASATKPGGLLQPATHGDGAADAAGAAGAAGAADVIGSTKTCCDRFRVMLFGPYHMVLLGSVTCLAASFKALVDGKAAGYLAEASGGGEGGKNSTVAALLAGDPKNGSNRSGNGTGNGTSSRGEGISELVSVR
jgi:hypothetical protein